MVCFHEYAEPQPKATEGKSETSLFETTHPERAI